MVCKYAAAAPVALLGFMGALKHVVGLEAMGMWVSSPCVDLSLSHWYEVPAFLLYLFIHLWFASLLLLLGSFCMINQQTIVGAA